MVSNPKRCPHSVPIDGAGRAKILSLLFWVCYCSPVSVQRVHGDHTVKGVTDLSTAVLELGQGPTLTLKVPWLLATADSEFFGGILVTSLGT